MSVRRGVGLLVGLGMLAASAIAVPASSAASSSPPLTNVFITGNYHAVSGTLTTRTVIGPCASKQRRSKHHGSFRIATRNGGARYVVLATPGKVQAISGDATYASRSGGYEVSFGWNWHHPAPVQSTLTDSRGAHRVYLTQIDVNFHDPTVRGPKRCPVVIVDRG
jgi:hypothetical protein